MAKLKKGDRAPEFELLNQDGIEESLVEHRGKKVLLFFYPKAGTSGCTLQARSVRDAKGMLEDLGIVPIGISPDDLNRQKKFDTDQGLGYSLLSDPEHVVAEAYGVWGEKNLRGNKTEGIIRSFFLIDEQGKIMDACYRVRPEDTIPKTLKVLKD